MLIGETSRISRRKRGAVGLVRRDGSEGSEVREKPDGYGSAPDAQSPRARLVSDGLKQVQVLWWRAWPRRIRKQLGELGVGFRRFLCWVLTSGDPPKKTLHGRTAKPCSCGYAMRAFGCALDFSVYESVTKSRARCTLNYCARARYITYCEFRILCG